jgi:hypothetical protein
MGLHEISFSVLTLFGKAVSGEIVMLRSEFIKYLTGFIPISLIFIDD